MPQRWPRSGAKVIKNETNKSGSGTEGTDLKKDGTKVGVKKEEIEGDFEEDEEEDEFDEEDDSASRFFF